MAKFNINTHFHFDSIRKKLVFFMTVLSVISVLVGVISSVAFSIGDMRTSFQNRMEITTEIIGSMSEGALLFEDMVTARETLSVLKKEREIIMACLYTDDGKVLGQYRAAHAGRMAPAECPASTHEISIAGQEVYTFVRPVVDGNGEQAGNILVVAQMVTLKDLIARQIWITVIIVLIVSILALGVAYILQPLITGPILSLVSLTKRISEEKDYSLRASTKSDDEIGVLSSSFNAMLATIQEREKELYEINEKAEAASRSKSEFLANMSHEIRTPINGILGFAQLLSVMPLEEKQRSFVDIILSSGNTLLTVINDILDFSKIEAGKLHIESVPFDLGEVVENVIDLMTARAEEKHLEIAMRYAPGTPINVIGDPGRVKQVLINYVSNAIKFTAQGHVVINVESRILGNTETIIRFEVIDTGIGISKEAQKKIFEKFMQADASTTKRYGGTGLGLAICQQLAHLMGGEVGVLSEEGKGSNFWFEVPFRLDQSQEQKRNLPEVSLAGCRLLIVDDHEVNRRILLELAEGWRVQAQAAESGEEALHLLKKAKAENNPFHIAILDYQLPNMDGEELSNLIKTDRSIADTSLILLTSMGMRGDAGRFQEIGFDAYLVKPARAAVLLDTVSTVWLNRKKGEKREAIITQHSFTGDGGQERREERKETAEPQSSPLLNRQYPDAQGRPAVTPPSSAAPMPPRPSPPHHAAPAAPARPASTMGGSSQQASAKPRILLVEDQLTNRLVVENILENMGLMAIHAENGEEAVQKVRAGTFDLILMDVQMPVMNGFDATREIRKLEQVEQRGHMPIIAVTANAMQGDREKCLDAGMDDYIAKPIQIAELQAMIRRFLLR